MDFDASSLPNLRPFEFQVAGHDVKSAKGNFGILKEEEGFILKPINKSPQGEVEIAFYERLNEDIALLPIKSYIPEYFGFLHIQINSKDVRFIKLRDVTSEYSKPCVMDVKIGEITWDPNATPRKRAIEDNKYIKSKKEFGFCIPGYVVYNLNSERFERFGKEDGKKLEKDSTYAAFRHFFNISVSGSGVVLDRIVDQLSELLTWWNRQRVLHIYSSSILLTYDAEKLIQLKDNSLSGSQQNGTISDWVNVYMIDFAHVFPANNSKDCNYISGLSKLLQVLKSLNGKSD